MITGIDILVSIKYIIYIFIIIFVKEIQSLTLDSCFIIIIIIR